MHRAVGAAGHGAQLHGTGRDQARGDGGDPLLGFGVRWWGFGFRV